MEQWKPVYANRLYEVSNIGRVKRIKTGRILKQGISGGRYTIALCKDGIRKTYSVHRLVGIAFIRVPERGYCFDHIDDDPLNNNIDNLQILSFSENIAKGAYARGKRLPIGVTVNHLHLRHPNWKKKFRAQINLGGKKIFLGLYHTPEEAHKVYLDKKLQIG